MARKMINANMVDARINPATAKRRIVAPPQPLFSAIIAIAAAVIAIIPAPAPARDLLFLGVTDVRGEPAQPELEAGLRAEFAAAGRFPLVGSLETERIIREMERQGRTRAEAVIPASAGLADSSVIVRVAVRELSVITKRSSLLLWGKIDAKMRLEVIFREFPGTLVHRGEFSAAASKRKDVILFQDPKKTVHVSIADREELLGRMRVSLIKDAVGLAATVFNAIASGGALPSKPAGSGADSAAVPDADVEYSTVDGNDVAPIDSAGGTGSAK